MAGVWEEQMQPSVDAAARESMWRAVEGSYRLGAALLDDRGRVMEATPGLARVFGRDALGGASLAEHLAAEDRAPLAHALRDVAGGAPERVLRLRPPTRGGSEALELRLLRGEDPTRPLTAIVADRSEQERIERRLVHGERLRLLGELLLGSAHELNNLLAVIVNASDAGAQSGDELALLRSATEDARRVVARLHSFGRAPGDEETPDRVDPAELLREALEFTRVRWQRQASAAGISIDVRTRFDACEPVLVARSELRHALVNLIVNAVDAMPRGGVLRLSCGVDGDFALLRVADTGTGFAREVRDRILEPFFSTKGERGLGLGLSIVAATVARHGGMISADSTPEYGTVFEIRLPLAREREAAQVAPTPVPAPAPCRVLVVEDNAGLRSIVARILRRDGHDVIDVESAEAALALELAPGRCDVVIADLSLPGISGLELATALRAAGHRMPFVLTSAWGIELDDSLRQARGVSCVLPKPYRLDALRAALGAVQCEAEPSGPSRRME